jgi:hypothetical protein
MSEPTNTPASPDELIETEEGIELQEEELDRVSGGVGSAVKTTPWK